MDTKTVNKFLTIASICFLLTGLILLCINIFANVKNNAFLCIALACIIMGDVFNIIRMQQKK